MGYKAILLTEEEVLDLFWCIDSTAGYYDSQARRYKPTDPSSAELKRKANEIRRLKYTIECNSKPVKR